MKRFFKKGVAVGEEIPIFTVRLRFGVVGEERRETDGKRFPNFFEKSSCAEGGDGEK